MLCLHVFVSLKLCAILHFLLCSVEETDFVSLQDAVRAEVLTEGDYEEYYLLGYSAV
jgi:hypothetical protein